MAARRRLAATAVQQVERSETSVSDAVTRTPSGVALADVKVKVVEVAQVAEVKVAAPMGDAPEVVTRAAMFKLKHQVQTYFSYPTKESDISTF